MVAFPVSCVLALLRRIPRHGRAVLLVLLLGGALPAVGLADAHLAISVGPYPDGTVHAHDYSVEALADWPMTQFTTSTVWTEGVYTYKGILLWDLLVRLGIDPSEWRGRISLHAIDGYSATLGYAQVSPNAPIVAIYRNGRLMPRRARGPFWLLFPYDDDPAFRQETIYALSVWQIERMSIEP